jgi:hypothetical protein
VAERSVVDRLQHAHDLDPGIRKTLGGREGSAADRDERVHAETAPCWHATSAPPLASNGLVREVPRMVPPCLPMPWMSLRSRDDVAIDDAPRQPRAEADEHFVCDLRSLENGTADDRVQSDAVSAAGEDSMLMCPSFRRLALTSRPAGAARTHPRGQSLLECRTSATEPEPSNGSSVTRNVQRRYDALTDQRMLRGTPSLCRCSSSHHHQQSGRTGSLKHRRGLGADAVRLKPAGVESRPVWSSGSGAFRALPVKGIARFRGIVG